MADKKKFLSEVKETIRFMLSSGFASLIDYTTYILLYEVFGVNINISYTVARGVGSTENFFFNNFVIFRMKGRKGILKRFVMFMTTVVIIALLGNMIIATLYKNLGIPALIAKLMTDTTTFLISFTSQKFIIFKEGRKGSDPGKTEILIRDSGEKH
jgi:putative flippase GtrA